MGVGPFFVEASWSSVGNSQCLYPVVADFLIRDPDIEQLTTRNRSDDSEMDDASSNSTGSGTEEAAEDVDDRT